LWKKNGVVESAWSCSVKLIVDVHFLVSVMQTVLGYHRNPPRVQLGEAVRVLTLLLGQAHGR
jgi:hypothetical protein